MKAFSRNLAVGLIASALSMAAFGQSRGVSDRSTGTSSKAATVQCSLKAPDGNSFEFREASYRQCVRDHLGPEADKEMERNIKEQGAYERALKAADRAKVDGPARDIFIKSQMASEGVTRR